MLQTVDQVHQINSNGTGTENNDDIAESRHDKYLRETFVLFAFYIEQKFLSIGNRTKIRKKYYWRLTGKMFCIKIRKNKEERGNYD